MKLELKTENDNYSKSISQVFRNVFFIALIITLCDIAIKVGFISRHYQIDYNCRILSAQKSQSSFKTLSRLSNLKSKQRIWDFCREFVK